jgi:dinuclear metal center YbgI/SA1388 family protein
VAGRDEIIEFCDGLLHVASFADYGPNGLQVPGRAEVNHVATGVSAHLELIERARDAGADLLLAHHGLFWDFHPRALTDAMAARLRLALGADLSIAGYHLPLDAHREIGNNALLCRQLGFEPRDDPFGIVKGAPIGVVGAREDPVAAEELFAAVGGLLGREPLVFAAGPRAVRTIGVVTGAGASEIHSAVDLGLDAFLTGEPAEHAMADAREGAIHFVAAGHYATETHGIRALGELVATRFGVEHTFIDVPNPI